MSNPFETTNNAPVHPAAQESVTVTEEAPNRVSITLKAGSGDAPWIVVEAGSLEEANRILENHQVVKDAIQNAVYGATAFQQLYSDEKSKTTGSESDAPTTEKSSDSRPGQPAASTEPEWASRVPSHMWDCNHGRGHRQPREGINRNGQPYWAMFCPEPKGQSCQGIFLNQKDLL